VVQFPKWQRSILFFVQKAIKERDDAFGYKGQKRRVPYEGQALAGRRTEAKGSVARVRVKRLRDAPHQVAHGREFARKTVGDRQLDLKGVFDLVVARRLGVENYVAA
jgi:hypothetical protein